MQDGRSCSTCQHAHLAIVNRLSMGKESCAARSSTTYWHSFSLQPRSGHVPLIYELAMRTVPLHLARLAMESRMFLARIEGRCRIYNRAFVQPLHALCPPANLLLGSVLLLSWIVGAFRFTVLIRQVKNRVFPKCEA